MYYPSKRFLNYPLQQIKQLTKYYTYIHILHVKEKIIFKNKDTTLVATFATIPLDITFVDADDKTRYFSHGDTRAFPRPKSCLGRDVYDCHPPKSQEAVRRILTEFRSGRSDSSEFWFEVRDKFLYVRYFAVRDEVIDIMVKYLKENYGNPSFRPKRNVVK